MTNKEKLIKHLTKCGSKLGCYTELIMDKFKTSNLKKILNSCYADEPIYTDNDVKIIIDVKIFINRKPYICEIDYMIELNEFDYTLITLDEYNSRYGKWEE